jgi:glycosyltransferase involved in cell wall biosynthesis
LHDLPDDHPDLSHYLEAWFPIMRALVAADAVTTTTESLAEHYRLINPKTFVLPNCIDPDLWPVNRPPQAGERRPVVVGYMGTHTHVPDLAAVTPALVSVLNRSPGKARLRVWGPKPPALLLNRPDVDWEPLALVDYHEFADFFAKQSCDVFIAPLCDNDFNRCKSHLKFLEYSALGVPGIYSRVAPYQHVVRHGHNGFLASDHADWRQHLSALIDDPALRRRIGAEAQEAVRGDWLISRQAARWREVYQEVLAGDGQVVETPARRLLRRLGDRLRTFEQELEQRDLRARLLTRSLEDLHRAA